MKLKLLEKRKEAGDAVSFVFEPETPITWQAGQFMVYFLPHENADIRGKQRFFTISAAPFEKNPSISTRIFDRKSSFKNVLNNMKIGDEILAKGPDGDFVIENVNQHSVFLAGGIGITPYRSIILDLDRRELPMNIILLYSNKTSDFPFKGKFDEIAAKNPKFKIHYLNKRIDESVIREKVQNPRGKFFYVTGPDSMVEETTEILLRMGIKEENIKQDYFSGYD